MRKACIGFLVLAAGGAALLGGCAGLPGMMERSHPGVVYRMPQEGRTNLYITIDDGPSGSTEAILAVLRKHEAPATFFVVSEHLEPELVRRILTDGHQLGHHMKTARGPDRMSDAAFREEFLGAEAALSAYGGTRLFRPAGGAISDSQADFVRSRGYRIVLGTVYPFDHAFRNETAIVTISKWLAVRGGILILHDFNPAAGRQTAAVLDRLIPDLRAKGYEFTRFPEVGPAPAVID